VLAVDRIAGFEREEVFCIARLGGLRAIQIANGLADDLIAREALRLLIGSIDQDEPAIVILDGHAGRQAVENVLQQPLALLELILRLPAGGHVPCDHDPADYVAGLRAKRADIHEVTTAAIDRVDLDRARASGQRGAIHRLIDRPAVGCEGVRASPVLELFRDDSVAGERLAGDENEPEASVEDERRRVRQPTQDGQRHVLITHQARTPPSDNPSKCHHKPPSAGRCFGKLYSAMKLDPGNPRFAPEGCDLEARSRTLSHPRSAGSRLWG
jgi:hypothetical protein